MEGRTVGEAAKPLVQFKLVVYWLSVLTLPAAIFSITVVPTPEDKVATAAPNGPVPAPVDVAADNVVPLLVACTL